MQREWMLPKMKTIPNYSIPWVTVWPRRPVTSFFLALIRLYQLTLSPFVGQGCRHQPTCSNYALEAYVNHGIMRGTWLTLKRVVRCNPWGTCGIDPVPTSFNGKSQQNEKG